MGKPFLVRCNVIRKPYMGDDRYIDDVRLVIAENAEDAKQKYEDWWHGKTEEYSVYYSAFGATVTETIE